MFCRKCGAPNDDNAFRCVKCGEVIQPEALGAVAGGPQAPAGGYTPPVQPPPNYLAHAILVTLFCCLPAGVPAIVYAAQVNSKAAAGDFEGALRASNNAKTWCIVSAILGVVGGVLWAIGKNLKVFS